MKKVLYAVFLILLIFLIVEPQIISNIVPISGALLAFNIISILLVWSKDDALTKIIRHWIIKFYKVIIPIAFISVIGVLYLIVNKLLPYDLPLFVISAIVIIFTIPLGNRENISNKKCLFTFVVFAISCINWMFVSYISYYSGVTQSLKEEANILQTATYEIMMLDKMTEDEKKRMLDNIYQQTRGEITLTKNFEVLKKGGRGRNHNEYELETQGNPESFYFGDDNYHVSFQYGNRPFWDIGLIRAVTFSTLPDWFDYRVPKFNRVNNRGYLRYGAYRRSTNLWAPFWVLYLIFVVLFYYVAQLDYLRKEALQTQSNLKDMKNKLDLSAEESKRAKEDADEAKREMNLAKNELMRAEERFENAQSQLSDLIENKAQIYQHMVAEMQQEMRDITTSQAKNTLQKMVSNWSNKKRSVFARKEYAQGLSAMETAAHDTRHILVNKWTTNEMYVNYPDDVKPYVDEILEDLKAIPNVISVKMEDFTLETITDSILEQYSKYRKDPKVKFDCNVNTETLNNNLLCHTNLHRINSIVFNLLSNSVKITNKFRKRYLDEHEDDDNFKKYFGKVDLQVGLTDYQNKKWLSISVNDNGGGFNDDIINRVYREPIKSEFRSKENFGQNRSEIGEGTAYIGFFVEMMNGEIKAKNYIDEEGFKGASTEILLPIINKE